MKLAGLITILAIPFFFGNAMAVPPGDTVTFGNVVFSGKYHADMGLKCEDCHDAIFKMKKKSAVITMDAIYKGSFCGACHNGSKGFNASEMVNCGKCHQM